MKIIASLLLVFAVALSGCKTPAQKDKEKKAALTKKTKAKLREENTDVDFQAFMGRLRKAATAHDMKTLSSMMTPDFGYSLNPEKSGDGVFQYWDEQTLAGAGRHPVGKIREEGRLHGRAAAIRRRIAQLRWLPRWNPSRKRKLEVRIFRERLTSDF